MTNCIKYPIQIVFWPACIMIRPSRPPLVSMEDIDQAGTPSPGSSPRTKIRSVTSSYVYFTITPLIVFLPLEQKKVMRWRSRWMMKKDLLMARLPRSSWVTKPGLNQTGKLNEWWLQLVLYWEPSYSTFICNQVHSSFDVISFFVIMIESNIYIYKQARCIILAEFTSQPPQLIEFPPHCTLVVDKDKQDQEYNVTPHRSYWLTA